MCFIGSAVRANEPIGMWGAASRLDIDVNQYACPAGASAQPINIVVVPPNA
ncbi:MAG TPA: hypothetical protein VHB21_15160 [Minicystis sp.]|nr:hypothetical protein [Minicystis sp.]